MSGRNEPTNDDVNPDTGRDNGRQEAASPGQTSNRAVWHPKKRPPVPSPATAAPSRVVDVPSDHPGMVRCQVTGKYVLPEDAVEFRGAQVSAEGKNILLRRLMGGAIRKGMAVRPSVVRRFVCWMLDNVILIAVISPFAIILALVSASAAGANEHMINAAAQIAGTAITCLYYFIFHGTWGKTLGKMAGKFHLVKMDGSRVDYLTAAKRTFWSNGIYVIPAFVIFISFIGGLILSVLLALYGIADIIALLLDSQYSRALHDRLAGTRVVMDE